MIQSVFPMNSENFLYLPASMRDTFIYRIVPVLRLFELFSSRRNVLTKPSKWADPFENFILKCRIQLSGGRLATFGFQNQFYGQCWTLQNASDAMWRIYSPNSDAVRIRSTVRKLVAALWGFRGEWARHEVFIGKVQYLSQIKMERFAKGILRSEGGSLSMRLFATTLMVKRPAFKHEREVRLILAPHEKSQAEKDLFSYPVEPNEFIDQIMVDPRMEEKAANTLKAQIKATTGFAGPIKRSLLYAPPPSWTIPL